MFMQVIQGKVADAKAARATLDRWLTDLRPGAVGWLGGTMGITDDGELVACIRFEDAAAARTNAARPEQSDWWQEMEQHFTGPVSFHDCTEVRLLLGGASDDAEFVQVIQGRVADPKLFMNRARESSDLLGQARPDAIGVIIAIDDDDVVTETISFTNEAAARAAEAMVLPPDLQARMSQDMAMLQDPHFLDLHHPWFASAGTH